MTEERVESGGDFELMDREDEEQILAELRGVPIDKFIYKNKRGEFELSYAGTKWVVREMANRGEAIRVDSHPKVDRCPIDPAEHIVADILAKRVKIDRDARCETVLDSTVGSARGWINQKLNDGRVIPDEFFYNKTVSKAVRNAQQALIPGDFKKEMIQTLVAMQNGAPSPGRQGPPPRQQPKTQGPPQQGQRPPQGQPQRPQNQNQAKAPQGAQQRPPQQPQQQQNRQPQGAQPRPPQQQPQRQPVPNTTRSAPNQSPREAAADVMHQRFEAMLRQACGNPQNRGVMIGMLKGLTGYDQVTAVPIELIKELGPVLHQVSKGTYKFENGTIHDELTGEILWPKPEPQAEPASEPQAEPPVEQTVPDAAPPPQEESFF